MKTRVGWEALLAFAGVASAALLSPVAARGGAEQEPPVAVRDFLFSQPVVIVGLRGGWAFNRSDSDIYDCLEKQFTLNESDFDSGAFAIDVSVRVMPWLDGVLGFEYAESNAKSQYQAFEEETGAAIKQKTKLIRVPLTASLKLYPLGRGRQVGEHAWIRSLVTPYLGGGIGATYYQLKQKGDFVDVLDPMPCAPGDDSVCFPIFEGRLESDGWGFSQHAFVGVDVRISPRWGLVVEGRYHWAEADVKESYQGFDAIDLDGARAMAGFSFRF